MSLVDNLMLFLSYGLVAAYCISAFRRIPTVKSKSGLFFASVAQAAGSIMASFTLITLFKLPVSHIPREFFPFVVVVIGSENMYMSILISPHITVTNRVTDFVSQAPFWKPLRNSQPFRGSQNLSGKSDSLHSYPSQQI